jgi:hypothetical protein
MRQCFGWEELSKGAAVAVHELRELMVVVMASVSASASTEEKRGRKGKEMSWGFGVALLRTLWPGRWVPRQCMAAMTPPCGVNGLRPVGHSLPDFSLNCNM